MFLEVIGAPSMLRLTRNAAALWLLVVGVFILSHTGLVVELEHLKIKTRLTNEKFASVKGECEIWMQ
jgi:hypothetical protein